MSNWLVFKYINLLSFRFKNFRNKGNGIYNFSCPFCDEITRHPYQGRGYIHPVKGSDIPRYFCHSCTKTCRADIFIKEVDTSLYQDYLLEKLKEEGKYEKLEPLSTLKFSKPIFTKEGPLKGLKRVCDLPNEHPVRSLVVKRKIPEKHYSRLYACPNFMAWTNTVVPHKFSESALRFDETRLLIPFFNKDKVFYGFQGRSLQKDSKVKYITIIVNDEYPKVYGLDAVDTSKDIVVTEGPIDALFLHNSLASAGGDIVAALKGIPKEKCIVCYDNEPRKKETVTKISKAIDNGLRVCLWPHTFGYKDINDAILGGLSSDYIEDVIKKNTFGDLQARMRLQSWSKA